MYMEDSVTGAAALVTPRYPIPNYKKGVNLCKDFADHMQQEMPTIFNETISNPCERYFCRPKHDAPPLWTNQTQRPYFNRLLWIFDIPHWHYYHMHQYCTLCEETISQNFPLILSQQECPWFQRDYCKDMCDNGTTCFYFTDHPVCYANDTSSGTFRYSMDVLHLHFVHLKTWLLPFVVFIGHSISLLSNMMLVVIPEIGYIISGMPLHPTRAEKFRRIFGLKNYLSFHSLLVTILCIIMSFVEIVSMTSESLSQITLYFTVLWTAHNYTILVILWWNIIRRVDNMDLRETIGPWQIASLVAVGVGSVLITVISALGAPLESLVRTFYVRLLLFSTLSLVLVWSLCISVALVFVTIQMFIRYKNESTKISDVTSEFLFKLKFTRSMVVFNIFNVPCLIIFFILALQSLMPGAFGLHFLLINYNICAVLLVCLNLLLVETLFQKEMFVRAWTCCCRHKNKTKEVVIQ